MNTILWIMAIPTMIFIMWAVGFIVYRVSYGFAAGLSFTWWMFSCSKVNGFRESKRAPWTYFPGEMMRQWWSFTLAKPGSTTASSLRGNWSGVFNWQVWKTDQ